MTYTKTFAAFTIMMLLSACSGNVKNISGYDDYRYQGEQYAKVTLSVPREINQEEEKFDQIVLKKVILSKLTAENLLDGTEASNHTIEINIDSVYLRSTGAAVMFGFMAGADSIQGRVDLKKGEQVINSFNVDASYAAGGLVGGLDGTRMDWLYQKFAEVTAQTIKNTQTE
ncbi:MAG: hypothetical protein HWE30_14160 [Methylocystaceae bacterium]|nr:hypothetical protein [Methylocystaceae bacterium]